MSALSDSIKPVFDFRDAIADVNVTADARNNPQVVANNLADILDEGHVIDVFHQTTQKLDADLARSRVHEITRQAVAQAFKELRWKQLFMADNANIIEQDERLQDSRSDIIIGGGHRRKERNEGLGDVTVVAFWFRLKNKTLLEHCNIWSELKDSEYRFWNQGIKSKYQMIGQIRLSKNSPTQYATQCFMHR